jgi:hypothetical protein
VEPVIADGFNELIKHQFLFNVTFDMCLIADVAVLLTWFMSLRGGPDESRPQPVPVSGPRQRWEESPPGLDHRLPPGAHVR